MHAPITNAGSARVLEGKIYVITFFVSETDWPLDGKMDLFKQMRDAESWLEKEAAKYTVKNVFPKWRPDKKTRHLEKQIARIKKQYLKPAL